MTRAVIELQGDLSPAMPLMSRLIKGCGYNSKAHVAAFRLGDMGVIVKPREVIITHVED